METKIIRMNQAAGPGSERLFVEVLQEYMHKTIFELNLKEKTQEKYGYFFQNIKAYLTDSEQMDLTLSEVRIRTMEQMRLFIQTNRKCSIGHASRHIELCKRVMTYAVRMEYVLNNPIEPIRAKRDKVKEVVHLEPAELAKFAAVIPKNFTYQAVRDLYLFQCHTGLSYADLWTFTTIEKDCVPWIANRRYKNDHVYYVPLFPEAETILVKYEGRLPMICNQIYNRYLQELAKKAGIAKHLTTHTARKCFASLMDQRGVSSKTISDMMGNSPEILMKHYLSKSTRRIETELGNLNLMPKRESEPVLCAPCTIAV